MKNSMNDSASAAVTRILEAFENGNFPQAIAYATFDPPANIPMYKWTLHNRTLAFLQYTGDARGFKQWKDAGRHVKKGAKAVYILGPVLKKSNSIQVELNEETGEEIIIDDMKCVGFYGIPVFRMEDTEGEPLSYVTLEPKSLPFADVATRWGLDVKAGAFNGEYLGYYCDSRKEIVLATNEEKTFLHELAHAAHYKIDPKAAQAPKWEKEIIAELSAGALLYMMGKEGHVGNHFKYITRYAEDAKLSPVKACMKILDTCLKVIEAITREANKLALQEAA